LKATAPGTGGGLADGLEREIPTRALSGGLVFGHAVNKNIVAIIMKTGKPVRQHDKPPDPGGRRYLFNIRFIRYVQNPGIA
jgi:hypothetical protein